MISKCVKSILDSRAKSDIDKILKRHEDVFRGIGRIYDKKNDKEFLVKFSMKRYASSAKAKTCSLLPPGTATAVARRMR